MGLKYFFPRQTLIATAVLQRVLLRVLARKLRHTVWVKVPHNLLQSNTSPSSKYHTTLFKVSHHPLDTVWVLNIFCFVKIVFPRQTLITTCVTNTIWACIKYKNTSLDEMSNNWQHRTCIFYLLNLPCLFFTLNSCGT